MNNKKINNDVTSERSEQHNNKKLEFLADHFMRVYENQMNNFDKFDQKMSWFFLFQSTLFIFLLTENIVLAGILFLSICFCVYAIIPKRIKSPYSPKDIINQFWIKNNIKIEDAQAKMVINLSDAISTNKQILKIKSNISKFSVGVFLLVLLILIIKSLCVTNVF